MTGYGIQVFCRKNFNRKLYRVLYYWEVNFTKLSILLFVNRNSKHAFHFQFSCKRTIIFSSLKEGICLNFNFILFYLQVKQHENSEKEFFYVVSQISILLVNVIDIYALFLWMEILIFLFCWTKNLWNKCFL